MKIDNLRRYIGLRDSLMREKTELEGKLNLINEALGESEQSGGGAQRPAQPSGAAQPRQGGQGRGGRGGRGSGGLSLRQAVLQVTSQGSATKEEILQKVKQLGYRFSTNNPLNSLGVILYGKNPRFKNEAGRFSPIGGASGRAAGRSAGGAQQRSSGASGGGGGSKRRQLSPEARERIAAAQRARWAKVRAGK